MPERFDPSKQKRWINGRFLPRDAWVRERDGVYEWRVIRWEPEDEPEPEDRRLTPATLAVWALAGLLVWALLVWGVMAVVG
jgi:hypothetical protein